MYVSFVSRTVKDMPKLYAHVCYKKDFEVFEI